MFRLLSGIFICAGLFIGLGCDGAVDTGDVLDRATKMIENGKNQAAIDILPLTRRL